MRSIKTLLKVLLNNQHYYIDTLHNWIVRLYYHDIISEDEKLVLLSYVELNKNPRIVWEHGNITPCIKWIERQCDRALPYNRTIVKQIYRKVSIQNAFKVMLRYQYLFSTGLCSWWKSVVNSGLLGVNFTLYAIVLQYLNRHKPKVTFDRNYWWEGGNLQPRVKWLNKQIKLLDKEILAITKYNAVHYES